ncbi:unnamed protein product [Ectocarpus sp. 6 AP-2014]
MRCKATAAGVGFLLSPVRLQYRPACYVLPRSIAWCSQPCSGVEKTRWWVEPPRCKGTHDGCAAGASTPAVAFAAMGGPTSRRRLRRIGRGSPMAAVHRPSQARGLGSISDDETPMTTPSASSSATTAAAVAAAVRTTAVVLELERGVRDTNILAVYGKLHRVLGATRSRRLLGANAVATLTSSNYLVLHHRDGGPSAYLEGFEESGSGGARLALGDRCWDICGIGQGGPTMDSAMREAGKEHGPLVADQRLLEREIESVVKIISRSEMSTVWLQQRDRTGEANTVSKARQNLRRLYARARSAWALSRTPPSSPDATSLPAGNSLMRVGLGGLISPRDCNTIVREALKVDDWAPWDGDLGTRALGTSLENLPLSRALWDGKAGDRVRARVAGLYGVSESSIVVNALFVCKVGLDVDGLRDEALPEEGRGRSVGTLHEAVDGAAAASAKLQQQQQQRRQQPQLSTEASEFRRSRSLLTFSVALSAEDALLPCPWAVCLEQRGECFRPGGQGTGVIFSGKLRHASLRIPHGAGAPASSGNSEGSRQEHPPVLLLRGFASIQHPSVAEESARWQWGKPGWHIDAPWIRDQDILDRVWVAGGSDLGAEAADGRHPPPAGGAAAAAAAGTAPAGVDPPRSYYLQRMNTTLAHRYYRQGLAGMDVPVVDSAGRPVIDLVEDGGVSSWWRRGVIGADKPDEVTLKAVLRRRFPWSRRRQVGKAGLSTDAGASPRMDAALQQLFGSSSTSSAAAAARREQVVAGDSPLAARQQGSPLVGVPVPPIKYVFVDPRYRGLGLGKRLFLEAMRSLARRGFRFALIVVEDNGTGGLFGFYEDMGFVRAEEELGLPRAMIAPIPPPDGM